MAGKTNNPHAHVFGPVPSRRLGRSLGVDVVPYKVCSLDCVYCQVGRTTIKTVTPRTFAPVTTIIREVREKLKSVPRPDYITLSGSGEPTLCADLGQLIDRIKGVTDVPVAILTNGTLLYQREARAACMRADLVIPSLDAGDEAMFRRINRPAPELTLEHVVNGMIAFREEYTGRIWLEVFLVKGINDTLLHAKRIRALAERIKPDKIQLNTAVRPTAREGISALSEERLRALCKFFGPKAEVIADFRHVHEQAEFKAKAEDVLAMIRRRPMTLDDIASGTGAHRNEVSKYVEELLARNAIRKERRGEKDFFRAMN